MKDKKRKNIEDFVKKYGLHGCKSAYVQYLERELALTDQIIAIQTQTIDELKLK